MDLEEIISNRLNINKEPLYNKSTVIELSIKELTQIAEEYAKEQQLKWISVEDRLPDCDSQHGRIFSSGYVLTYDSFGEIEIGEYIREYIDTDKGLRNIGENWLDNEFVTHWMPLPTSPLQPTPKTK